MDLEDMAVILGSREGSNQFFIGHSQNPPPGFIFLCSSDVNASPLKQAKTAVLNPPTKDSLHLRVGLAVHLFSQYGGRLR